MPKEYGQACPVAKSLEFLGERWTLLIVRDLFTGPKKFQDLLASLKGVAPGVLSHRLKVLEEHEIIRRQLYSDHPPRAEYTLTERGAALRPAIRALAIWGAQYLGADRMVIHDRCGSAIEMAYYCPSCNELVAAGAASYRNVARHAATGVGRQPKHPRRPGLAARQTRSSTPAV
jgi:DNA-binding HxlR family transcriptional regulator